MEEEVRKELETLKAMVLNWKRDFLGWAPPEGGGDFLGRELAEEIETHVYPYIRRMYECDYLTQHEVKEFLEECYGQVEDLLKTLKEKEANSVEQKEGEHA